MTTFVYTDTKVFGNSSVLNDAQYNSRTGHLLVNLISGVAAGYENVPEGLWNNFIKEESLGGSAGSFWNRMIKDHFTGFDTAAIDDWSTLEEEAYERASYRHTDEDFFNPTPSENPAGLTPEQIEQLHGVSQPTIQEAAPDEAPELDQPSDLRPEDFPEGTPSRAVYDFLEKESPEIVDVRAGADIGQRRYEIIVERTVVTEHTQVVYANSEDEALVAYNDKHGAQPGNESSRIVGITRRF